MLEFLTAYHSACLAKAASAKAVILPTDPVIYLGHSFDGAKYISTWNFQKARWDSRTFSTYASQGPSCKQVCPSSDGRLAVILTGGVNKLVIFNADTQDVIAEIDGTFTKIIGWRPTTNDVLAVTDASGYVKFYDAATWTLVSGAYSRSTAVNAGEWSPEGAYIVLGFASGSSSSPSLQVITWATMTAFSNQLTVSAAITSLTVAKGREGTAIFVYYVLSNNLYGAYLNTSTSKIITLSLITSIGFLNNLVSTSSKLAGIVNGSVANTAFRVTTWTAVSGLPAASTATNYNAVTWTGGGTLVAASPQGRYLLGRISQTSGMTKQFNYYDASLSAYYAGFDTGLSVNDFRWDPRGSL
jgi:hypothetical protein